MSSKEREGGCSFGIQRDAFSWLVEFRHGIPKRATCVQESVFFCSQSAPYNIERERTSSVRKLLSLPVSSTALRHAAKCDGSESSNVPSMSKRKAVAMICYWNQI